MSCLCTISCPCSVQQPIMDGIECTKAIREHEKASQSRTAIPIVCLTGEVDQMEAAFQAGMNHYLTKPVSRSKLHEALRTIDLQRSQAETETDNENEHDTSSTTSTSTGSPSTSTQTQQLPVVNLQVNMFVNATATDKSLSVPA
jgi:DNA-binding NarL/FixJ family response regulator